VNNADEALFQLVCYFVFGCICATICGIVAHHKGRNVLGWAALGMLGLLPLILVCVLPNVKEQAEREAYVAEENRRLREQLRQERIKSESFRQHASARLDAHDQQLGLDTRGSGPALGAGIRPAGQLAGGRDDGTYGLAPPGGSPQAATQDVPRWYYGLRGQTVGPVKGSEIVALIRQFVITRETLLWSEDLVEWQPAVQVGDFTMYFA
jgi:hypothetical protein